jgi:hypothetical protein
MALSSLRGARQQVLKSLAARADAPLMTTIDRGIGAVPVARLARGRTLLGANGLLVGICAAFVLVWSLAAASLVRADSWLTLLAGREIVAHGLPSHDTLAILSDGRPWVDQQWLAQLCLYGLAVLGGMKLAVLTTILLLAVALALAVTFAERRGASAIKIVPFAVLGGGFFTSFVRTQVFSQLLFVVLLGLLCAESRRPSRRVFLAFPLLAVWANLHGAVLVGAVLVTLLGCGELAGLVRGRRWTRAAAARALALTVGPWACVLITPYGLSVVDYYRSTLTNPLFRAALTEWQPPTLLSPVGFPAFALSGAVLALLVARGRLLTGFERAAFVFTAIGALTAVRSITWLAYAALMLLPALLEDWFPTRRGGRGLPERHLGAALAGLAAVAFALAALAPQLHFTKLWPAAGSDSVSRVLRSDPHARVFASFEYGDWLLYTSPDVRRRIAFDGRWEILTRQQMRDVLDYLYQSGADWERPGTGYRVLVLNPVTESRLLETYTSRGARVLFRDRRLVILDRGRGRHE